MNDMYPYIEYMKVFVAYVALLYAWPSIIFRKYLKGKGLTFRFIFCGTVPIVLLNGVVLGSGLFGILNVHGFRILFWGSFFISVSRPLLYQIRIKNLNLSMLKEALMERGRWKLFFGQKMMETITGVKGLWQIYKTRVVEYIILIVILLFGMAYFSIGTLQNYSYGHYDQITHYGWILDLEQGNIFTRGIYPQAMHCFIYGLHHLFGVKIYSCMLFLAGIHISAFLLSAYCLLKEIFQCRYTSLFILIVWLTFDAGLEGNAFATMYWSMTRLTWTLPQEFGLYVVFLCPLALFRFLRMENGRVRAEKWYENDDLVLLMLGIGTALATHFYVIIFAFFICLAIVIVYFRKMLSARIIISLLYTIGNGINIGAIPMIIAHLMGMNPDQALRWGINRFNGVSEDAVNYNAGGNNFQTSDRNIIKDIYEKGYVSVFGEYGAIILLAISALIILFVFAYRLYRSHGPKKESPLQAGKPEGYLFIVYTSILCVFLYAAPFLGLPEFIAVNRIFTIFKMLVFAVPGVLLDLIFLFFASHLGKRSIDIGVCVGCIMVYCMAYLIDFHEYLYRVLMHYNAPVLVTNAIEDEFCDRSYMIVSTFEENGQLEQRGKHEEIYTFLSDITKEQYYIQAEYIFLYVEKHPLIREQRYYFTGPRWLADKSSLYDADNERQSQSPNALHTEISLETAQQEVEYLSSPILNYYDVEMWTIMNSKAYYWYQDCTRKYPERTEVYYEDDDFVCYMVHQDPESPIDLTLNAE